METLRYHALAIGSLAGTIIGVGMFGLPYAALKAGFFLTAFYLLVFGVIVAITHLLYAEVTMRTKENHRLTGYAGVYLGTGWKTVTFIQGLITLWGTLLVYTIVAAGFSHIIFSWAGIPISEVLWGIAFFLVGAAIVWGGDTKVGAQEVLFMLPMALIIIFIFVLSFFSSRFSFENLLSFDMSEWVLPYGITLFSLAGFSVIPLLEHILAPARKKGLPINYPLIIFLGTLIPAFLYLLFVWGVLGVSGAGTSEDALSGLAAFLGPEVVIAGAALGIFSLYTSFIAVGNELAKTFVEDYGMKRGMGFLLALGIPFLFYLFNVRDFITIAEFIGAVMGGYVGILSVLLFWKAKTKGNETPPFSFRLPRFAGILIIAIFAFASLYAVIDIISPFLFAPLSG